MEPFTTQPDVRRASMIDQIAAMLAAVRSHDYSAPRILNLYGIAGIGKSFLLRQIFAQFKGHTPTVVLRLSSRRADIDFDGTPQVQGWDAVLGGLRTLPGLEQLTTPPDAASDEPPALVMSGSPAQDRVTLLMIDDASDYAHWDWLQEQVIKPLVETKRLLVLITSHIQLFWELWELEQQCQEHKIPQFTAEEIEEYLLQIGLENLQPLTPTILEYTHGYPLAVEFFVRELRGAEPGYSLDLRRFPAEVRALLPYVGMLRLAEVEVMDGLLAQFTGGTVNRLSILELLSELEDQKLLQPNLPGLPRQFDPCLRSAVAELISPALYLQACRYLVRRYAEWAAARPKTHAHALLEWLYFSAELVRLGALSRSLWVAEFDRLFQRLVLVNRQDPATASPLLFVLFYRDKELVDLLKHEAVGLYSEVDERLGRLLDVVQKLRGDDSVARISNNVFRSDFDSSCAQLLDALFDRLQVELLPEQLQDRSTFQLSMRAMIKPDSFPLDALRRNVSVQTKLPPREIDQVVDFFGSRGLVDYDQQRKLFSFNPLIHSFVALADRKVLDKALLSISLNSPQ